MKIYGFWEGSLILSLIKIFVDLDLNKNLHEMDVNPYFDWLKYQK